MMVNSEGSSRSSWIAMGLALLLAAALGVGLYHSQSELDAARQRLAELETKGKPGMPTQPEKLAPVLKPEEQKPVLENLKPLLKVENEEVRARAVELTALVAPKESDLLLDQVLRTDPSPRVKLAALDVIGKQKIAYCRSEMLNLLKSEDAGVRRKSAWALGALGVDPDQDAMKKTRAEIFEALRKEADEWAATLVAKTPPAKPEPKTGKRPVDAAPPALTGQAFGLLSPYIQALGEIGDAETAEKIAFLLDNLDSMVRRETVLALGKIGAPESKKTLIGKYVLERDAMVQNGIVTALTGPKYGMRYDPKAQKFSEDR